MKIFINLKSIKKNPNAGQSIYHVAGPTTTTISFQCASRELLDRLNSDEIRVISFKGEEDMGIQVEALGCGDMDSLKAQLDAIRARSISIVQDHNIQQINSMFPEPEYNYKHLNSKVTCNGCMKSFPMSELKEDGDDDYENNTHWYSDTICPKCGEIDCCELKFETITEALDRKNN